MSTEVLSESARLIEQGRIADAARRLETAIALDGGIAALHAQLARCLIQLKRTADAAAAAQRALALRPTDAFTLDTLGVVFSFAGDHERAARVLQQATAANPDRADIWYNLGASQQFNGDFAAAEIAYERAVELEPSMDKAAAALSHLRRQTPDSNHVDRLLGRLQAFSGPLADEMRLRFALAKEYDDLGNAEAAISELSDVCGRWRMANPYDAGNDAAMFDALIDGFDTASVASAGPGYDSTEPVFIVGMPRTGTTLTERIVTAHSAVHAAGELHKMDLLVRRTLGITTQADFSAAKVRLALAGNLADLGRRYIESTRPATGNTPHFVDKMPLNFLYAGFILLALPGARIVCVRRNPMDTCLSNFRQLFSLRSAYYAYSYDLLDCGRYYLQFDRLMRHWDELFPGRIHTVGYESLIDNQEQESRALIDYCGLGWEDACLNFERNPSPVATASSAQVREPVYRSAVARWKRYGDAMRPLAEFFERNGIAVGAERAQSSD